MKLFEALDVGMLRGHGQNDDCHGSRIAGPGPEITVGCVTFNDIDPLAAEDTDAGWVVFSTQNGVFVVVSELVIRHPTNTAHSQDDRCGFSEVDRSVVEMDLMGKSVGQTLSQSRGTTDAAKVGKSEDDESE